MCVCLFCSDLFFHPCVQRRATQPNPDQLFNLQMSVEKALEAIQVALKDLKGGGGRGGGGGRSRLSTSTLSKKEGLKMNQTLKMNRNALGCQEDWFAEGGCHTRAWDGAVRVNISALYVS